MRRPLALLLAAAALPALALDGTTPPEGLRERRPSVHALTNARIVVSPDRIVEKGTLVLRDGRVEAVGEQAAVPADARVVDCTGKTLWPAFLDLGGLWGEERAAGGGKGKKNRAVEEEPKGASGAAHWNPKIRPERRMDLDYAPDVEASRAWRAQGVSARLLAPGSGILRGTGVLVTTGDGDARETVVLSRASFHAAMEPEGGGYPTSKMGAVALLRQSLLDAEWYRRAWDAHAKGGPRPESNAGLEALAGAREGRIPFLLEAPDEVAVLRAAALAREFSLRPVLLGSGQEYQRLEAVAATGLPLVIPLKMPEAPALRGPEEAREIPLEDLLHWDLAPENPARLGRASVPFAFSLRGLKPEELPKALRRVCRRGLPAKEALAALTLRPAAFLGLSDRRGSLEPGRAADLVVSDGDLFDPDSEARVLETWVDGRRYVEDPFRGEEPRGVWESEGMKAVVQGKPGKLSGRLERDGRTDKLREAALEAGRLRLVSEGGLLLSGQLSGDVLEGTLRKPDGSEAPWKAKRAGPAPREEEKDENGGEKERKDEPRKALFEPGFPFGAYGRPAFPARPDAVLFKNATVWTSGPEGILERASVLVREGKIAAVGRDLPAPEGALVVDCLGRHLTPGILDCHSHVAIDGDVNEAGQSVTAEVRIGDVIDPDDIAVYRELAGGVTAANLLHGSANAIGGQNQVVKFRWGALPEAMKLEGAPGGIKFALGENPTRANADEQTRYPATRMGVESVIHDAFQAAREYRKALARDPAARRDLELEAVAEILEGKRLIHCHAYRQDEMLMLMRLCEAYGVRIGTFQHVLEGYKIAPEIRRHGAGASTFSDWWAYKIEVYDAIPYNAALLTQAGVVVSLNSDSAELGRRLNTEAAKAVKYGGMSPEEALKLVTLNPARQLGISARVGSLEPGKDADLALWSAPPLSTAAVCEETWVDGRRMFSRAEDRELRAEAARMREALLQRLREQGGAEAGAKGGARRHPPRDWEEGCGCEP